jgi:hypothetical protein
MDTITRIITGPAAVWTIAVCIVGLLSIGIAVYWLFNRQARSRDLARLRKKLDELKPSDPEYGAVRALYTSMVIDAERGGVSHSGPGSADGGSDGGSGGGDH